MLKKKVQEKQIQALKSKNRPQFEFIQYILAQIKNAEIEKLADLTDDEVKNVLSKIKKQVDEAIEAAKKGNRNDVLTSYEEQKKVLLSITE
jgi:uncharacterized protein YqeY